LNTRVVIEQAKGALARVHGISVDEAFERMRRYTRGHNRKLSEVAYAVLSDLTSVAGLTRT
jgi:AmiR/NasT family two-component response regulator